MSVPSFATAAAILYVACLMAHALKDVEWNDVVIKVLAGRWRECPTMLLAVALVFAAKFVWL